jgi:hypothetical protein
MGVGEWTAIPLTHPNPPICGNAVAQERQMQIPWGSLRDMERSTHLGYND